MSGTPAAEPTDGEIVVLGPGFSHWEEVLALILAAFDYMNGLIDPPSSALRLTAESLQLKAEAETALAIIEGGRVVACLFCDRRPGVLYVGKLAVDPARQGAGFGSRLIERAETLAREAGLPALDLQTRVELGSNHAYFASKGFAKAGEGAHDGYSRPTWIVMRKTLDASAGD